MGKQAEQIIQKAKGRFVAGNPRAWWLSLRVPYRIVEQEASPGGPSLMRHWTGEKPSCWLVPETEEGSYPVYQTIVPVAEKLLSECSFFEYYLLNKTPSFGICDCCGVEFGYEDATPEAAGACRRSWLARPTAP